MIDLTADPQSKYIQLLKNTNVMTCEILDSFHANGGLLCAKTIVWNSTQRRNQLTKPHSRERQNAISTANSQGDIFLQTGGIASNCDDVFIAIKRKRLQEEQNKLLGEKKEKQKNMEREKKANEIVNRVGGDESRFTSSDLRDMIAWKLGKPCPSHASNMTARRRMWQSLQYTPPCWQPWTEKDEEKLIRLTNKINNISIDDTEVGKAKGVAEQTFWAELQSMPTQQKKAALDRFVGRVLGAGGNEKESGHIRTLGES